MEPYMYEREDAMSHGRFDENFYFSGSEPI